MKAYSGLNLNQLKITEVKKQKSTSYLKCYTLKYIIFYTIF